MQEEDGTEGDGEDDGVDRLAALLLPVDVVQVEDERELVEDEGGAGAERGRQEELEKSFPRQIGELQSLPRRTRARGRRRGGACARRRRSRCPSPRTLAMRVYPLVSAYVIRNATIITSAGSRPVS